MEYNTNDFDINFENYLREAEEKRSVRKTANFVGGAFILSMLLPFVANSMITKLLKAFGVSQGQTTALFNDPMFSMVLQIFFSIAMFILPLGIILYGEHLKLSQLISFKKPKKDYFLPLTLICIGVTAFANIITNIVASLLNGIGIPVAPPQFDTPKGILGFVITFLAVAVTPALVEELAFRGVVMGSLKKYGKGFAVGVSAILFGMMHGNLSQLPFAFILGIAISFAVIRTDSIWTGVIIHFINNGITVVMDEIISSSESARVEMFITAMYFSLCILAFFVGVYLLKGKTKELFNFDDKQGANLSKRFKWFFSAPTVIVSIGITAVECLVSLVIF